MFCNHCDLYVYMYVCMYLCVYGEVMDKGERAYTERTSSFSISLELYLNGLKRDFKVRRNAHTGAIYMNGHKGAKQN
jgi:hypothetical protein